MPPLSLGILYILQLQVGASLLAKRLQEEWLRKLWGIEGKEPSESRGAVGSLLAGLQPEVADVLGKVQKAASEETFPDQMDLLNNLLRPLQGMRASIDGLFASIDKAKNPNTDKEREVEMMVAHIQVNIHIFKVPTKHHQSIFACRCFLV